MSRFTMAIVALSLAAGVPTASAQKDENRRDYRRDKDRDHRRDRARDRDRDHRGDPDGDRDGVRDHRRRPPEGKPAVRGFSPKAGPAGTQVTIRGFNLPDGVQVMVGRHRVEAAEAGRRRIRFAVPAMRPGSHRISIQAGALRIPVGSFDVQPGGGPVAGGPGDDHHGPDVGPGPGPGPRPRHRPRGRHWWRERMMAFGYRPQKGPAGTRVVVRGNNFAPDTVVMLGRREVKPIRVTENRVVFKIPRGGKGDIIRLRSPSTRRTAVVGSFEYVAGYDPVAERKKLERERRRHAEERWKKRQRELAKDRAARRAAFEKWDRERRESRAERRARFLEALRKKWKRAFLRDEDTRAELALHAERSARLERMKRLAEANNSGKLAVRIDIAMQREDNRHERRMAALRAAFEID